MAGIHVNGTTVCARKKFNMRQGLWLLFDRDFVDGMLPELAELSFADWCAAMELLFPGFIACGKVILPSTSTRVLVDGQPVAARSCHVFVRVTDANLIEGAWSAALLRSVVTSFAATPWDEPVLLGFARPKHDRARPDVVVAVDMWTIFDRCTAYTNRLVFDGCPIVEGHGLTVGPPVVEVQDGPPLDLSKVKELTWRELPRIQEALTAIKGTRSKMVLKRAVNGSGTYVCGVDLTTPDLTMDLELETDNGRTTVRELHQRGAGHTRCQSPYRDSTSWAAYYGVHSDGAPFIYDTGTHEKHVLQALGLKHAWEIIRDWYQETYQAQHVCRDGQIYSEVWGKISFHKIRSTPEVIERLLLACDAPRDKEGVMVRWNMLPGHFSTWKEAAWGAWVADLPYEGDVTSETSADDFKLVVANLMAWPLSMNFGGEMVTASLGAWARAFATLTVGEWVRVRDLPLWGKLTLEGILQIAFRPELAARARAIAPEIKILSPNNLTRLCRAHQIGDDNDNRFGQGDGRRLRVTVLSVAFVQELNISDIRITSHSQALAAYFKDEEEEVTSYPGSGNGKPTVQ